MDFGGILSKSFSDYKNNLKFIVPHAVEYFLDFLTAFILTILLTVALTISLPSFSLDALESLLYDAPFFLVVFFIFTFLFFVSAVVFFSAAARTAIIGMAGECFQSGKTTLNLGFEYSKKRSIGVLLYNVFLGVVLLAFIFFSFLFISFLPVISVFILISGFIAFIILYLLTLFAPQSIVLYERGVFDSLKWSYNFVRANAVQVLLYIATAAMVSLVLTFFSFSLKFFSTLQGSQLFLIFAQVFQFLFSFGAGLIISPYFEIVKTYMVMEA